MKSQTNDKNTVNKRTEGNRMYTFLKNIPEDVYENKNIVHTDPNDDEYRGSS